MKKILSVILILCMALLISGCSAAAEEAGNELITVAVEQVITIVARILEGVLAIAFAFVLGKIGENTKLKSTKTAMELLQEAVIQTVGELQQLYVIDWKEMNGGKLTPERIRQLQEETFILVHEKLSDVTKQLIEASGADLEELIRGYTESYLNDKKMGFYYFPAGGAEEQEPAVPYSTEEDKKKD